MRTAIRQMGMALVVASVPLGCERPPPADPATAQPRPAHRPTPRASLEAVVGEVTLKRASDDTWTRARAGQPLFENDSLRTAPGASAQVRFTLGSVLMVGPDALVGIAESQPLPGAERSDVTVLRGRIDAELPEGKAESLTVATPAATVRAGREIVFQ